MKVILRPTIPADLPALIGEPLPWRIKALTALAIETIDGIETERVIGVGGLAFLPGGTVAAWAALTDELRAHPLALHKAGLRIMREAKEAGVRAVVASADPDSAPALRWLARHGFVPAESESDGHPVFVWRSS